MRVIQVRQFGLPDVLVVEQAPEPQAGPGQAVISVETAGVLFADTMARAGKYPVPLPFIPGLEVAGRVIQVGSDGDESLVGQRVVARTSGLGGYAEQAVVDVSNIFRIPDELSFEQATGVFSSGQTAVHVLSTVQIETEDSVLITAAAGSTGSLLVQLVKQAGVRTVIGAARGKDKLAVVSRLGADAVVDYSDSNWVDEIRKLTDSKGADVVLDAVGGDIGRQAFEVTANGRGRFVVYGWASGSGIELQTQELTMRGMTVIGALGKGMTKTPEAMHQHADFALQEAAAGRLVAEIGQTYPLERAADAHAALETRQTIGKVLLIPS
jgi:NADPH2:quinone reductase